MSARDFHARLRAVLNDTTADRLSTVTSGACGDYAEYKSLTGFIEGIVHALNMSDDLLKQMYDEE